MPYAIQQTSAGEYVLTNGNSNGVSPLLIKIMFACHSSPGTPETRFEAATWDSPAAATCRDFLLNNDLIDQDYRATARGRAWILHICDTPLPEQSMIWAKGE